MQTGQNINKLKQNENFYRLQRQNIDYTIQNVSYMYMYIYIYIYIHTAYILYCIVYILPM